MPVAEGGSPVQWVTVAVAVGPVRVRAALQQEAHRRRLAAVHRRRERRLAAPARVGARRVDVTPRIEQHAQPAHVAVLGRAPKRGRVGLELRRGRARGEPAAVRGTRTRTRTRTRLRFRRPRLRHQPGRRPRQRCCDGRLGRCYRDGSCGWLRMQLCGVISRYVHRCISTCGSRCVSGWCLSGCLGGCPNDIRCARRLRVSGHCRRICG